MGLGIGSSLVAPQLSAGELPPVTYGYRGIQTFADATNAQGELALRLALSNNTTGRETLKARIKIKNGGRLSRTKSYFLEPPDQFTPQRHEAISHLPTGDTDVVVAWIREVGEKTMVEIKTVGERWQFSLAEVLEKGELEFGSNALLTVNLLGYSEVGKIDLSDLNVSNTQNFRFTIMADPQGGNPKTQKNEAPTRMKIHNAFVEDTVALINALRPKPVFTLILGDFVDSKGQEGNFLHMEELIKPLKMPVLLEVGNHETPYNADFTPAYNMTDLNNFFSSQKRVNGTEKMAYSFDLGSWHFVVWPDPLRPNFWSAHPHYFDWLENDLEAHKERPVVFLHHVPLHPIGIDPLTSYVESVSVKRLLMDILTRHGNVKYALSGHVHIPLRASLKTAVNYKGVNMINLPAAGFRPRAFGEADFFGGPEQGACIVDITADELSVHFQHVTGEWFTYPSTLPKFDANRFALWFNEPWQLPLQPQISNGDFSNGLKNWYRRFVYHENENPSNICEVRNAPDGTQACYLYSRKRGYDVPGQDRLPQHINRIVQAVSLGGNKNPVLKLGYRPEKGHFDAKSLNGFFLWVECYHQSHNVANLVYSVGKVYGSVTKVFGTDRKETVLHFDLPSETGLWHNAELPIGKDFDSAQSDGTSFGDLNADRAVLYLGTWTVNEGIGQEAGIYIKHVSLETGKPHSATTPLKTKEDIWYSRVKHIAGDHQYVSQEEVYPEGLRGEGKPK